MKNHELLLNLVLLEKGKIEKKLNQNTYQQLIFILIGLSIIFKYDTFLNAFLKKYLDVGQTELRTAIPLILELLFMRFGYCLSKFISVRKSFDHLLNMLTTDIDEEFKSLLKETSRSNSLFEVIADKELSKNKISYVNLLIQVLFIVNLNHFICLYFIDLEVTSPLNRILLKTLFIIFNGLLYYEYLKYNRKDTGPLLVKLALSIFILTIIYFGIVEIWH